MEQRSSPPAVMVYGHFLRQCYHVGKKEWQTLQLGFSIPEYNKLQVLRGKKSAISYQLLGTCDQKASMNCTIRMSNKNRLEVHMVYVSSFQHFNSMSLAKVQDNTFVGSILNLLLPSTSNTVCLPSSMLQATYRIDDSL